MIKMRTTFLTSALFLLCILSTSYVSVDPTPSAVDLKGPCDCEEGWNFVVHQITPQGCREKSIYCTQGVKLEPGYSCGTCPKPCSTCEEDEEGNISICRIYPNGNTASFKAGCDELQDFFKDNGDFKYKDDHCGPCTCADQNDKDTDGDGVCDKKDACPEDPNKSKEDDCGCHEEDTDDDGVCDNLDACPDDPYKSAYDDCGCHEVDTDLDGICDALDECPFNSDKSMNDQCGCDDQDSDGDGICDKDDEFPGVDDNADSDNDGIPDALDVCDVTGNNTFEWIESVSINGFNNKSGADSRGYGSYGKDPILIAKEGVLRVWINVGHTDAVCELSHAIFVDWNQDRDFDDQGEMIFNERNTGETGVDYQLPENIQEGTYAMRILVDLGRIYGACGGCIDGEAEDYTLRITEASCDLVYEGFNYQADSDLQGKHGGKSWKDGWQISSEGDAKAKVINTSLSASYLETIGNKLGVLNTSQSKLSIHRSFANEVFQKNGDVWISFQYELDKGGEFAPKLNESNAGFYVDKDGFIIIGGLKSHKLLEGEVYTFLIKANLNAGTDEITLWINPSDSGADYSQNYNVPIDGHLKKLGFRFKGNDNMESKTIQYLDEIRVGCSREDVLPQRDDDLADDVNDVTSSETNLKVYPNPMYSGETVVVNLNNAEVMVHSYVILDSSGKLMYEGELQNGENALNLPPLESGIYIIELKTEHKTIHEKIVIQNE